MKRMIRITGWAITGSIIALFPLGLAAQSPVTVTGQLGYRSHYLFAGIPFAAEGVTQATLTAASGSLTLNGFGVFDHDAGEVSELDLYGDYYVQAAPMLGVFFGGALYSFNILDEWETTPELYAGVVLTALLNPTLYFAHDFDLGDGTHVTLMVSHELTVDEESGVTVEFSGNLDYNDGYYSAISAFSYFDVGVTVGIPVGSVTLSPMLALQRGIDDTFVDEEVLGVTASYLF